MRYRHDDPRLDEVIAEQAAAGAAAWPVTPQTLAALAPLLAPPSVPATAKRRRRPAAAPRRAA
jgi:hypothetical protein